MSSTTTTGKAIETAPDPATGADLPALGAAGLEAWRNFIWANAKLMEGLDEELRARHAFTIGDYDVLVHLARAPQQRRRMCDLAEAVLLSPSGLSRRVERLERAGLVERRRAESDARSIEAGLTAEGKSLFQQLNRTHLAGVKERFVNLFTEAELEQLAELLGRLLPAPGPDEG
jgi:DNA-binding MarR family transcriptional regulator